MSKKETFEERYKTGVTPWELDRPDSNLVQVITREAIPPCKALDIGCGTGSSAIWLAQKGFDVTGIDFSPLAIEKAKEKSIKTGLEIPYVVKDFLEPVQTSLDVEFIFDRGCFHSFDDKNDRHLFAKNAGFHLKENGVWFSISGNADDAPRDVGPPMRSALDIVSAVEPFFEILSLASGRFDSTREKPARCWLCLMRKRKVKK
ncbi:MAG: class I SAM-dependent methyltransferase [Proteobacteria bacterium]|nr:class I SAM-dependent methyltransferase [Pseudomonadota bacterium]MBU1582887.1 class I SAM-dependent methyltransferase [Pseudomonadota bacterium]MBU2451957.1 class I SAM-dependent methyltransferase [Pseudomonadota bacterium]MBU2631710.1 class I SAM-dependent methyltransferase [Pseudomonadota bacterium]